VAKKERQKLFKYLRVTSFHEEEAGVELTSALHGYGVSVFAKPRKVAKELRRIARWLEKK
jgi:hypothetical protein